MHLLFSKYFSGIWKKNPSLSKPISKYLVKHFGRMLFWKTNADLYGRWCFITSLQVSCNTKKKLLEI